MTRNTQIPLVAPKENLNKYLNPVTIKTICTKLSLPSSNSVTIILYGNFSGKLFVSLVFEAIHSMGKEIK